MITNPFPSKGVSEFPLKAPFIGQEEIYKELKKFKKNSINEPAEHCFIIGGDWGEGKSRIGHEIVAQCLDMSKGWHYKDQESKEKLFSKSDEILPIFLPYRHIMLGEFEINEKNILTISIIRAFQILIKEKTNILDSIRDYIKAKDEEFLDRLESQLNKKNPNIEKAASDLIEFTLKRGFKRIYLIFDEVETPGDLEFTTEDERGKKKGPELADIRMTANCIKESLSETNTSYNSIDFFYLCSKAAYVPFSKVPANERRIKYRNIGKVYIEDYLFYIQLIAKENTKIESYFNRNLIAAMYIIVDGNFGWFNYLGNQIFYELEDNPDLTNIDLLKEILPSTWYLFDNSVMENLLTRTMDSNINNYNNLLFDYVPKEISIIEDAEDLLKINTVYGNIFSKFKKIKVTQGDLVDKLCSEKLFELDREHGKSTVLKLATEGHKELQQDFRKNLLIFPDIDDNKVFYVYEDSEQFSIFFNYCLNEDFPGSISTLIHEALMEFSNTEEYLGLSFEFLLFINKRMQVKSSKKMWLNKSIWDKINEEIEKIRSENKKKWTKIIIGIINLIEKISFKKDTFELYPNHSDEIEGLDNEVYYFINELHDDSILNISESRSLLILNVLTKNYLEIFKILKKKIKDIGVFPIITIFNSEKDKIKAFDEVGSGSNLAHCLIPYVISNGSVEHNFLLRYGFYNNTLISSVQFTENDIRTNYLIEKYKEKLESLINKWKEDIKNANLIFKPIVLTTNAVDKKVQFEVKDIIKLFENIYKNKDNPSNLVEMVNNIDWSATFVKKFPNEFETQYINQLPILSPIILHKDNKFDKRSSTLEVKFPSLFRRILEILNSSLKLSEIAKEFFYISTPYKKKDRDLKDFPLKNVLKFLTHFYIIKEENKTYRRYTPSNLSELSSDVSTYIAMLLNPTSASSIQKIREISQDNILVKLKINEEQLKRKQNAIKAKIDAGISDILDNFDTKDENEIIDALFELKGIAEEFNAYLVQKYNKDFFKTKTLEELKGFLSDFDKYEISEEHSLRDRIEFVKAILEKLQAEKETLINKITALKTKLQTKLRNINGFQFPLESTILSKYQEIQNDLDYLIDDNPKIRVSETTISIKDSLKVLRGDGALLDVISIIKSYSSLIEKIEDDITDIYNQLKTDFFDKWEGVSRTKDELQEYLDGVPKFENDLDDISKIFNEYEPYYSDFGERKDIKDISLDDLSELSDRLKDIITDLEGRMVNLSTLADEDIISKINSTDLKSLNSLENRLEKEKITDDSDIWNKITYFERIQEVENFKIYLKDRGENYLNKNEHLWDIFKIILQKLENEVSPDEIYKDHVEDFDKFEQIDPRIFVVKTQISIE